MVDTDLPKLKLPSVSTEDKKAKKPVAAKKEKAKAEKPAPKKEAKPKAAKAEAKKPVKATKSSKPTKAKVESKAPKKEAKGSAITADAVAAKIIKAVAGGKVETIKADHTSSKSVVDHLVAKAAAVLLKTFSDKVISNVNHDNSEVGKAAKAVLAKNAAVIRNEVVGKHAKKYAGAIVKAAKSADAGKLAASDLRAVTFA